MKKRCSSPSTASSRQRMTRTLVAAAGLTSCVASAASSETFTIAGVYQTKSKGAVTASRIDLDQTEIESLLEHTSDENALSRARYIFETGMHSGPYAKLTLAEPLSHTVLVPESAIDSAIYTNDLRFETKQKPMYALNVVGGTKDYQSSIHGKIRTANPEQTFRKGVTNELTVLYPEDSKCNVDGNLGDCFAGPDGGLVLQGYGAIDYKYEPQKDNHFLSSLKGFSEDEGTRMLYCELHGGCRDYKEYQHFYDYYGILDYGNHWINAGFDKSSTAATDKLAHGNQDFSLVSENARNHAVAAATVAMNVFTQVNRVMVERGIDGCRKNARDFSSYGHDSAGHSVVDAWDVAAATYAGSALIEGESAAKKVKDDDDDEEQDGSLYFGLVEKLAREFGVLESREGIGIFSIVNRKVMDAFRTGRDALLHADCDQAAKQSYEPIVRLMRVPWVQGVLKSAFLLSEPKVNAAVRDEQRGRGMAFVAALLPDLHHCSAKTAQAVHEEFRMLETSDIFRTPDYETVRNLLEEQYECLGVTCDEVGGYLNEDTGNYFRATRPCGGYGASRTQRRESVAYDVPAKKARSHRSSSSRNFISGAFLVALMTFGASLSALFVAVNEYTRRNGGRRIVPGDIVSAVSSHADYWMSGILPDRGSNSHRSYDYAPRSSSASFQEVQLQPMVNSVAPQDTPVDSLL
mmetsp:Transcript_17318/g.47739  ORF Transcript_17318/g.47739 Transcript_17318/m.47739 type:complete len:690 (-) Transcript_17318:4128-6197(-)